MWCALVNGGRLPVIGLLSLAAPIDKKIVHKTQQAINSPPTWLPICLREVEEHQTLDRGERLFQRGEPVRFVFFVRSGGIKAVRYQQDGRESIMVRAMGGDFFAESSVIVSHYACDAFTTHPTSLLAFPANQFRDALTHETRFAFAFANHQAAVARHQCSRYERLRLPRARDRVLHLLSCEADSKGCYPLLTTQAELATELGLEPETLYRTLAELKREGLVESDRKQLQISPKGRNHS